MGWAERYLESKTICQQCTPPTHAPTHTSGINMSAWESVLQYLCGNRHVLACAHGCMSARAVMGAWAPWCMSMAAWGRHMGAWAWVHGCMGPPKNRRQLPWLHHWLSAVWGSLSLLHDMGVRAAVLIVW